MTRIRAARNLTVGLVGLLLASTCALISPAAAAPSDPLADWDRATIPLATQDLVYDASRDQILAVVAPSVPGLGNRLVEVDPADGSIGRSVALGSTPSRVVISDDGSRAYVALARVHVVEVDLTSFAVTRRIPVRASDLAVQPGAADVLAVLRPDDAGVAVFDDGVQRTNVVAGGTLEGIVFGGASTLYASRTDQSGGMRLVTIGIDGGGATAVSTQTTTVSRHVERDVLWYSDGYVFARSGQVVDPTDGSVDASLSQGAPVSIAFDGPDDVAHVLRYSGALQRHGTGPPFAQQDVAEVGVGQARVAVDTSAGVAANLPGGPIELLGPGVTDTGFAAPEPTPTLDVAALVDLDVSTSDLAAAPDGSAVYAVVRNDSPLADQGDLLEIDPVGGEITRRLRLSGQAYRVEANSDGSRLYISDLQSNQVREVDVDTFSVTRTTTLPHEIWRLVAVPGTADRYVVTFRNDEGVGLVIDGTLRPNLIDSGSTTIENVVFLDDATEAYVSSGDGISTVSVGDDGLAIVATAPVSARTLAVGIDGDVVDEAGYRFDLDALGGPTVIGRHGGGLTISAVASPQQDRLYRIAYTESFLAEDDADERFEHARHPGLVGSTTAGQYDLVMAGDRLVLPGATIIPPFGVLGPPGTPSELDAVGADLRVTLTWTTPPDGGAAITGYRVYRDGQLVAEPGPAATSHVDLGLENGQPHEYQMTAVNAEGESLRSAPVTGSGIEPPRFTDVSRQHPFFDEITWGALNGLVNGYGDGSFRPGTAVSRQAMAAFIFRLLGEPDPGVPTNQIPVVFPDVPRSHPFFLEISFLYFSGLADGYPDGRFHGGAAVSRQANAAFFYRLLVDPNEPEPNPGDLPLLFRDVGRSHPFFLEITFMGVTGLSNGYSDGTYRPLTPVSRQATAAFFYRLVEGDAEGAGAAGATSEAPRWPGPLEAPSASWGSLDDS